MALIKCGECGHQVSDKAKTCPRLATCLSAILLFLVLSTGNTEAEIVDWREILKVETLGTSIEEAQRLMKLAEDFQGPNGYEVFKMLDRKLIMRILNFPTLKQFARPHAERRCEEALDAYMTDEDWENVKAVEKSEGRLYRQQFGFLANAGEVRMTISIAHRLGGADWKEQRENDVTRGPASQLVNKYPVVLYIWVRYLNRTPDKVASHQAKLQAKQELMKAKEEAEKADALKKEAEKVAKAEAEKKRALAEQRASGQLSLAKNFAKNGRIQEAIKIGEKALTDYPDTKATKELESLVKQWKATRLGPPPF